MTECMYFGIQVSIVLIGIISGIYAVTTNKIGNKKTFDRGYLIPILAMLFLFILSIKVDRSKLAKCGNEDHKVVACQK